VLMLDRIAGTAPTGARKVTISMDLVLGASCAPAAVA
jgi:hypothetical protein